jgi:hypothetical protein
MGKSTRQFKLGQEVEHIDQVKQVSASREFEADDIGKILYVTAAITLTWPATNIPEFHCNIECNDTGTLTIADSAVTPGDDLSAPNGTEVAADGSAYVFIEPVGSKLRISM